MVACLLMGSDPFCRTSQRPGDCSSTDAPGRQPAYLGEIIVVVCCLASYATLLKGYSRAEGYTQDSGIPIVVVPLMVCASSYLTPSLLSGKRCRVLRQKAATFVTTANLALQRRKPSVEVRDKSHSWLSPEPAII